ncbi:hypothetical protein F7725_006497 [Dissostichus mawsoni]|uniref:ubiquitinyl hydrolase 1 n=1 Tax=Dissostichus mawsoni TaxID=36200 RepID=A0A7J5XU33_DISMA|nr:hypothetical protein F7725_006497 [Dissostichus mawsoni]
MPSLRHSYTVTAAEEPASLTGSERANLRRKSPPLSRTKLVSTFMGLIINQAKNKSPQGLVGLRNLGNTCFMNSILQCLSNTSELRDYCLRNVHRSDLNNNCTTNAALMEEFAKLTQSLWTSVRRGRQSLGLQEPDPEIRSQICGLQRKESNVFSPRSQQDAQEFLRFLLDGLHNEVNRVTVRSKIHRVRSFLGLIHTCAQKSSGEVTLRDCLRLFTKEDVLDGEERPTCNRCKTRRKCTKRFSIQKFPQILVLRILSSHLTACRHLKRFSDSNLRTSKLSTYVNFPLKELDLREFSSDGGERPLYNLYAVSNHSGNALGGHYTAYCKSPALGEWYNYNDCRVSPVSSSQVRSSNAYVLFYEMTSSSLTQSKYQTCRL